MVKKLIEYALSLGVPKYASFVLSARSNDSVIRTKNGSFDPVEMPLKFEKHFLILNAIDMEGLVIRASQ